MKGLDTNVIVRLIMNDNPHQAQLASQVLKQAFIQKQKIFVSALVILETNWVLKSIYQLDREIIILALLDILGLEVLSIEYHETLKHVLEDAKNNTFDLSDLLIGAIAQANNCEFTLTFDQKASKSSYFELLN